MNRIKHLVVIVVIFAAIVVGVYKWHHPPSHSHPDSNDESEQDETLQLTAYSDNFELFAEVCPFVTEHESDLKVFISRLEDFKPLLEGSLRVSLIVGTDSIDQMLEKPEKPGIYHFKLKPAVAGLGKMVFDIETSLGKTQIVMPDIMVYSDEQEAFKAAAAAAVESSDGVRFTKEQRWKVDFATSEIRREPFGQIIRTMAQVQPSQGDERIISAKTGGTVFFNTVVTEGKAVRAGQTLFTIDGSATIDNNLAVRYAEAAGEYNRAKAEYERKAELAKENIVSQSDLLAAKTEFESAEIAYDNLRNNFPAGRQNVSSPINGYVTRVLVQKGEYVEAGQPALVVSQNRTLFIKADLRLRHFSLLNNITTANIRLLNSNTVHSLESLGGHVVSYGKSTDISNPLIPITFQVNNTAGFVPGSFVEMFIKTQTSSQAITVPNEAIVEEMGNHFVFVQLTPEFFDKRSVKKGVTDGVRTEIKAGNVAPGDRVISKGAIFAKLAQAAGALDAHAGHAH
ncbi:MAG: efflux RND transporter periplasmic adaptor subunit [Fibromonadaceae bacterium]|jgi:RND family efflux transporter MFP subunit|nr:efflux RND transporter periplasmic adaptor subunit [Fibromonadaceae bacterium]